MQSNCYTARLTRWSCELIGRPMYAVQSAHNHLTNTPMWCFAITQPAPSAVSNSPPSPYTGFCPAICLSPSGHSRQTQCSVLDVTGPPTPACSTARMKRPKGDDLDAIATRIPQKNNKGKIQELLSDKMAATKTRYYNHSASKSF